MRTPSDAHLDTSRVHAGTHPNPLLTHLCPPELRPWPLLAKGRPPSSLQPLHQEASSLAGQGWVGPQACEPFPTESRPLLSCRHGSLIWAWRAGPDLQPDMDPGGMPALDLCPLHEGPEGPTLALGGGGGVSHKTLQERGSCANKA